MSPNGFRFSQIAFATGLLVLGGLAGCSSSDDDGGDGSAFNVQSLSGNVRAAGGTGLAGVTVSVGTSTGTTDANGDFIIPSVGQIPSGQVTVEFDGSTSTAPGEFPVLDVIVDLEPNVSAVVMPQVITLPDLMSPNSGQQTVPLAVNGASTAPISVVSASTSNINLSAPTGTIITIGGAVGASNVDLNITPVPPIEVPMPLPDGMLGGSYVTIQPGNASFDSGAGLGLDLTLPNTLGLVVGDMIDIWSFDHDAGAWVNRSQETGQMGLVVDNGGTLEVQATGVILEGGWHTAAIPVDTDCATTFSGHVEDAVTGDPIAGASIALGTGQFASTDVNGDFVINSVPAYDTAALAIDPLDCVAVDLHYEIVVPPSYGSLTTGSLTVPSASIMAAGTTTLADVQFAVPVTGTLAGLISGDLNPGELVLLTDSFQATSTVAVQSNKTFIQSGLAAGDYSASYLFAGSGSPTTSAFSIDANTITTINLQFVRGSGGEDISITVLIDDDNPATPMVAADSAQVMLVGTDAGSSGGLLATTDSNGLVEFMDVTGPYTITAVKDLLVGGDTLRFATSLVEIDPAGSSVGIFISVEDDTTPTLDATLSGTVSNLPSLSGSESIELYVEATNLAGDSGFSTSTTVNPGDGSYSVSIPSGIDFDLNLMHADFTAASPIISSMVLGGVSGTTPAGTLTQDWDFGSAAVIAWDQPTPVSFANIQGGTTDVEVCVDLYSISGGVLFFYPIYDGVATGLTSINLPDFSDPNLAGLEIGIFAENTTLNGDQYQECDLLPTSNPTSLAFDFITIPSAAAPFAGAQYTLSEFENLTVNYTEGTAALGSNGLNFINFEGYFSQLPGPVGIDGTCWSILVPAGLASFAMPRSPLPLFSAGDSLYAEIEQVRFAGTTFDYDSFFDADLEQNLSDLQADNTEECDSGLELSFDLIQTP